ncbi:YrzI family small protein [Alkalihalobacterium alkalinitrilicum]|nr:YrzI family small protein [Alkalihalobacterium alkalinitrilicum]
MTIQFLFFTITITKRKIAETDVEKYHQREQREKEIKEKIDRYRHVRQYF